ncbi:unnamed protein product [Urochloa humidicola]
MAAEVGDYPPIFLGSFRRWGEGDGSCAAAPGTPWPASICHPRPRWSADPWSAAGLEAGGSEAAWPALICVAAGARGGSGQELRILR